MSHFAAVAPDQITQCRNTTGVDTTPDRAWARPVVTRPWVACFCLFLLPVAIHLPALIGVISANPLYWVGGLAPAVGTQRGLIPGFPGWADFNAGVTTQALGALAADQWLSGRIPWWNPYSGIGLPLAAEMQSSALYLPFVLLLKCTDGVLLLKIATQILTGLATFGFLRQCGVGLRAALVGAVFAECQGTLAWFSHAPILPLPYLPLLMLGIERARAGRHDATALIALAIGFSVIAGFPETAYLDGLLGLAFASLRVLAAGADRWRLASRIALGGTLGVLVAAPAWLPFAEFLPHAYLSVHADDSADHLLRASAAMLLFPYVLGPILFGPETIGQQQDIWWHSGGYCDLFLLFLALVGLASSAPAQRGLRRLLAGWVVITAGKAFALPLASSALNLLPFVRHVAFHLYIVPSWAFSAIVLASFGLDDWHRGTTQPRLPWFAAAGVGLIGVVALWMARPAVAQLFAHNSYYAVYPLANLALAISAITVAAILLSAPTRLSRSIGLCAASSVSAALLFAVPLLSGIRDTRLDLRPVAFLRDHLGLARFYGMSVIQPSYSAYFGIASVGHIYLPVPQNWVDFLHMRLSPSMDGVTFFGDSLRVRGAGIDALREESSASGTARDAVSVYESLGVRYIVVPHGVDPFSDTLAPPIEWRDNRPFALGDGDSLHWPLSSAYGRAGTILAASVLIGTYASQSDGTLAITVCAAHDCAAGVVDLGHAADNALAWAPLDHTLATDASKPLSVTFAHHGSRPVAIWLWPSAAPPAQNAALADATQSPAGFVPLVSLRYAIDPPRPSLAYADDRTDIYALNSTKPYFDEPSGVCSLHPLSREAVSADCRHPAKLIRRELVFPGWQASIDDQPAPVGSVDTIFQAVDLPTGTSIIRFRYAPPYAKATYFALVCGLAGIAATLLSPHFHGRAPRQASRL